ncbi:hypothetical protein ARMSODRAFT_969032 [Armillaria solidipes]|uniref:Amine oxidase n=1 Tax=Armillaria solidipes TaxID=1076256 RepID=A0A2H3CD60_9AGAR|nr:hypothetical protein ARMSODRAFT_969032 [Armillaria solidipes]
MLLADSLLAACITTTAGFYPPQAQDAGHFKTEPGGWREGNPEHGRMASRISSWHCLKRPINISIASLQQTAIRLFQPPQSSTSTSGRILRNLIADSSRLRSICEERHPRHPTMDCPDISSAVRPREDSERSLPRPGDEGKGKTFRRYIASKADIKAVKFIITYPLPSSKKAVLAYLGIPLTPGGQPEAPIPITRKAKVDVCAMTLPTKDAHGLTVPRCYLRRLDISNYSDAYNDILTLDGGKWGIESLEKLPEGVLPEQIVCDGWSIGYDDRFPQKRRIQQASISARLSEHGNLYAHSLISLLTTRTLLSVALGVPSTSFPELSEDAFAVTSRPRIQPPLKSFDFLPDLMEKNEENFKPRDNIKPLHIVQPEGVSFKLDGNELEWQDWKMHISFNHREGECKYAL